MVKLRVLVTGATGYIGGAVAGALGEAGHEVYGLTQSPETRVGVTARHWRPVAGDLRQPQALQTLARGFDAVVHAGNVGGPDAGDVDREATRAFMRALAGSGRPLIYTSGTWVLGAGQSNERSEARPAELVAWRALLERELVAAAPSVRAVVVRPGIVYGRGGGIPGMLARGELPVVAPGGQHWPLVHVDDLADLYVRSLGAPGGTIVHGVAVTRTMGALALLARGEAVEVVSLEEARRRLGAFGDALALDQHVDAAATQSALQWQPSGPSPEEELPPR